MISASSLERIAACPMSARLPQVESESADSRRGVNVHLYLANVLSGKPHLQGVEADYHDLCTAIDTSSLPTVGQYEAEAAFAFNVSTGAARRMDVEDRRYEVAPKEIPGTADAVGLTADRVVIIDWKGAWSKATVAADNLQLRFYALCAARVYGRDTATVAIARVAEDRIRWDVAELSVMDLDLFVDELAMIWKDAQDSQRLAEGEHCRYCPAFDSCPAKTALVRSFLPVAEAHAEVAIETMDDAARLEVWDRAKAAERVIESVIGRLRESIARKPIIVGDRALVIAEESRRTIDVEKAIELAPELTSIAKRSMTITDVEKALGKNGLDRIADAVKVAKFSKVKEMKSAKLLQANR